MPPFMRVVLAGLLVFAGLMAGAGLVFTVFPGGTSPALLGTSLCIWIEDEGLHYFRGLENDSVP